jgi:predicted nucleic acid-binding protein
MMARVLIDTNGYTALLAGDKRIADILAGSEAVLLSPVVIGELLDGFLTGNRNRQNRDILAHFRSKPRTVCVPITDETSEWFALIKQQLRKKGKPIPINDVWIAASCLEHGAKLITFDTHFSEIEGLLRVDL